MRDNGIRHDIIECALFSYNLDNILKIYTKANILNKLISKEVGADVIFSYKRAFNILINESKYIDTDVSGNVDPGLFKNDFEKILYKKIYNIRKDFTNVGKEDDYKGLLLNLASVKKR